MGHHDGQAALLVDLESDSLSGRPCDLTGCAFEHGSVGVVSPELVSGDIREGGRRCATSGWTSAATSPTSRSSRSRARPAACHAWPMGDAFRAVRGDARPGRRRRARGVHQHLGARRAARSPCRHGHRVQPAAHQGDRLGQAQDRRHRRGHARRAARRRLPAAGLAARRGDPPPASARRAPGRPGPRPDGGPQPGRRDPRPAPGAGPDDRRVRRAAAGAWLAALELPPEERLALDAAVAPRRAC